MGNLTDYINAFKGISGTGSQLNNIKDLLKDDFAINLEPGDFVVKGKDSGIVTTAPVDADLWYLWNHVNGMTWIEKTENTELYMTERLAFLTTKLGGIKALKGVTNLSDVTRGILDWDQIESFGTWKNLAKAWFQLIAFEILFNGQSFQYNEDSVPAEVVGYLTFPVGQLGTMEVISLIQESLTDAADFNMQEDEKPNTDEPKLFVSFTNWIYNKCYGRHLVVSGYIVPTDERGKYIPLAKTHLAASDYGVDVKPKGWGKLWITRGDKFPVPGEFVGILCKPLPVPPHVWWFQNSSPFLYAGNWFDTFDLTSGVIVSKAEDEVHPTTGVTCTGYRVKIHGREVDIYSSDFVVYEVGTRVGIFKIGTRSNTEIVFDYKEQAMQGDPEVGPLISEDYVIIPITFYEEET